MGRESWSNEKLLARLINNKSNRTYWSNISELRKRGSFEFFEQCVLLAKSEIPKERIIGIDILSQLNSQGKMKPYSKRVFTFLLKRLQLEKDPLALMSILFGIGHNNEYLTKDKDIEYIIEYRKNENNSIRECVVFALLGIDNAIAINTLIELSKDKFSNIRNWAVFGLGSQLERNTDEIKQALFDRVNDKHIETKSEAILGLAIRKDFRVKELIRQELLTESFGCLLFEAIEEIQDVAFLPILEDLFLKNKDEIDINDQWLNNLKDCISNLKLLNAK